jgi:hypothetical protein
MNPTRLSERLVIGRREPAAAWLLLPRPCSHLLTFSPAALLACWLTGLLAFTSNAASPLETYLAANGPRISVSTTPPAPERTKPRNWIDQTHDEAMAKSHGCLECHAGTDTHSMHTSANVVLGCTDCHGGNASRGLTQRQAHVQPANALFWESSANPVESSVLLNHESAEFIQFVNPGDLRVADRACGLCHGDSVAHVRHSIMRHGAMLWGAALYNNGAWRDKNYRYGQAYGLDGVPLRLETPSPITPEMTKIYGVLPYLDPLPRFVIGQPSNILRIFEKGGEKPLELGLPNTFEPPGKPLRRLSERGLGSKTRIDPVWLNLQKTRLHDPLLDFMGSNNHPGDYRSSGCSACHVVYANDRSPSNSDYYAKYGHQGLSFSGDPAIPKNERGHPIKHVFTRAIPTAQCMNCHMHQGNLFVNPFLGYTWWDQETDGEFMYPHPDNPLADDAHFRGGKTREDLTKQKHPTEDEISKLQHETPEGSAARGLWSDKDFLDKVAELNPQLKHTQFADYHGHGWIFRAIFKRDKQGNLLDLDDGVIPNDDAHKWEKAVHLKDVHLARGMHCVDCHFLHDMHGNGMLYGDPRAVTSIECVDCHGTINSRPTLMTSGTGGTWDEKAGKPQPVDLLKTSNTPWGPRFFWEGRRLFQRSSLAPDRVWEVPQTLDTIDPQSPRYSAKSAYAKTLRRDGKEWGDVPAAKSEVQGPKSKVGAASSANESPTVPDTTAASPSPFTQRSGEKGEGRGEGSLPYWLDTNRQPLTEDRHTTCAAELAHDNSNVSCQICHTSWATSCFGCHLPMRANQRVSANKFEGTQTRNYTTYNPQVVRDDVFQLGIDATYKHNRLAVLRSSSAVIVGSQNANREWIYSQQQTVSAEGYSGQAYNPHFPHTTSSVGTTKNCTECHLSEANDNNAWMTSLLGFGTGTVNFFGRHAYVGCGEGGLEAVVWTERDEPQAALGSHLHKLAYHDHWRTHTEQNRGVLKEAYHHHARDIRDLVQRGEYLYTANGPDGFEVFDVANIDNKGFSERIVTTPVSPLGQRTRVKTKFATSVILPSTLGVDPLRLTNPPTMTHPQFGEIYSDNEEQPRGLAYGFAYVTDREEGLVNVLVGTLVDGNPSNNFLDEPYLGLPSATRFNPDGKLTGLEHGYFAGAKQLYLVGKNGLFVVDVSDPTKPVLKGELLSKNAAPATNADGNSPSPLGGERAGVRAAAGAGSASPSPFTQRSGEKGEGRGEGPLVLNQPHSIAVQWRYAFVSDVDGVKVADLSSPYEPKLVASIPLAHAGRLYAARTYLYVPDGPHGLAIVDIANPAQPKLVSHFTADGAINDARAVQIGSVAASMYALLADGKHGLRVIQLISPENVPNHYGFSPAPNPKLIATYPTHSPAVAVGRGLDRDRVVDESGGQTVVFGRRGSRPFSAEEFGMLFRHLDSASGKNTGPEFRVNDVAGGPGPLRTKAGNELKPTREFVPEPKIPAPTPRHTNERLVRRGR